MKNKDYNFGKLIDLVKLEKSEIFTIYFYAALSGLIQLSLPLGIQSILGFVQGGAMVTSVYFLIFIIIMAVLVVGSLQINQMKIIEKIQQKIFVRYALAFADTIPKFDLKEVDKLYLPESINRFFDTLNIQKGVSKLLLDIPLALIQILFGLILLGFYHSLFIVFSIVLVFIFWLIFKLTSKNGLKTSLNESKYKYSVVAWLQEMGRVIKSFKYSQGTHLNLIKTDQRLQFYLSSRTSHFKVLLFQYKSLVFIKVCVTALMLILGTYLLFNQMINIGQFVASEIIFWTIINASEKLITCLENVYDVATGLYKIDHLLEIPLEKEGKLKLNKTELNITVSNLSFGFHENQTVFNNFSASFPAHSITGISGDENTGKSTLLSLLSGSYKDFKGNINFNNIPIESFSLESIRSQTGILLYQQDLFEGTLYENITLGRNDISIEKIIDLIYELGLDNFISFFPNAFDTHIDPLGGGLPSSMIRKILLLRATIHASVLLLLEEPWSGLEQKAKVSIQNYLLKSAQTKTIIVTTNDQEFIQKCSHHIHLSNQ
ncbi:MAG: ATP-binding cassette domain-containing protein [Pseudarcicella sp.]|nr:ATP-binding cassette domain-containing protein [Pseudarcicella sp.]MBP6409968.1 ATP-binding cassette domain-containing protein [Pseudarcicella sp.]